MGTKKQPKNNPEVQFVTEASQLNEVCDRLRQVGTFAFDTEFIKEDTFEALVCLMQVATDDQVFLIDPLAHKLDVGPLWSLVGHPETEVVVHAGMEDMALCHLHVGHPPKGVFDVQIAAGVVGLDYPLSLARLLREILGVRLHKSQTLSDWRRRPLSDVQHRYAVDDVVHLPAVHRFLRRRLAKMNRDSWAVQEFDKFADPKLYGPTPEDPLAGIKGAGSLDSRSLAIARGLARERAWLAKRLNRPLRAVLRDHLLVEIARRGWTSIQEIRSLRGIQLSDRALRRLADAVQEGKALPKEQLPAPNPTLEETPEEAVVVALATAVIRAFCLENRLAFPLVCNRHDIRTTVLAAVRGQAPAALPPLMTGWRQEAIGPLLDHVLSGRAALRVTKGDAGPKLNIE